MSDATEPDYRYTGLEIAVIGMAGRFPSAASVEDLWSNLLAGVEGISRFDDDELIEMGVSPKALEDEHYVRAKGVFPDIEYFDSRFFNYTPADATVLDPQVRALHEEVYHALEDAGYSAEGRKEAIGLFLGATNNMPWEVDTQRRFNEDAGSAFSGMQLNDKDFAATRISHSLGLRGPAFTLHTACSSSLVAIDVACRNVWTGSCQIALAGGSGLSLPHKNGYQHRPNMVHSPDGHCRAFDAAAGGTVEGNGVGIVVLKRLEAALRDGDRVYAVIKGSAVNNDGTRKVGYTAPSIEGQAEVIRKAHRVAGVKPSEISYVEAHGTGTALGDPVEMEALSKAFGPGEPDSCGVGSLKASIGHLDTAAGVASFIKACKVLKERTIPQSLHFDTLNPGIRLDGTPFYIAGERQEMRRKRSESGRELPLRAGVSAFGIGGTNAHLVLEEAPEPRRPASDGRAHNTFVLSAASAEAITRMKRDFVDHLAANPDIDGADLAWTLQNRQRDLPYRYAVGFGGIGRLRERLQESLDAGDEPAHLPRNGRRDVYLLFSGAGAQHLRMARGLYETESVFRARVDDCLAITDELGSPVVREVFFGETVAQEKQLNNIAVSLVLLFVVEYSMARTLLDWGIRPRGMIGHSTGELVAACVAGVFSLEDGLRLVLTRGSLVDTTPEGAVTSVKASEDTIRPMLTDELSIAAVNAPEDCTVSGASAAIAAFEERCAEQGITFTHVEAAHAYHSQYMEPILEEYREIASSVDLRAPEIPYVSNVTGTWVTPEQATDPDYYCEHIRRTVRFKDGVETIMERGDALFIEVGPGKSLSSFVRGTARGTRTGAINMLRHRLEEVDDGEHLATAIRKLWEAGVALDWPAFHKGRAPSKVRLPLYAFDRTEYPIDIGEFQQLLSTADDRPRPVVERRPVSVPATGAPRHALQLTWSSALLPDSGESGRHRVLLVFTEDRSRIRRVMDEVPYWTPLYVEFGGEYRFDGAVGARVRRGHEDDLRRLAADLEEHALVGDTVVVHHRPGADASVLVRRLCDVVSGLRDRPVRDLVLLETVAPAGPEGPPLPEMIGLNLEYPHLRVRALGCDTALTAPGGPRAWSESLRRELEAEREEAVAARYRDGGRFVPAMVPLHGHRGRSAARSGRTVVVCPVDAVDDVLSATGPERSVDVLPFAVGADGPTEAGARTEGRSTVMAAVTGRTGADTTEGLISRLRALKGTTHLVLWDTSLRDAARTGSDASDAPDPGTLSRRLREAGDELGTSYGVVSRADLDRFEWNADVTARFARNAVTDAEADGVRLYSFGRLDDGDPSVLDLLYEMRVSGMRTGYHGLDLLETAATRKAIGEPEESGAVDERSSVAAVIEREMADLLGLEGIDARADLFDTGLDSLKLIQFTSALERHGYTVLASDVHSHPTIGELAGLLARSDKQVNQECDSLESAAALLGERLESGCALYEITAGADEEESVVLFVDGFREEDRVSIVRRINELRLPQAFTPHYILPREAERDFLAGRDFASLRLGGDPTREGGLDRLFGEIDRRQEDMRRSILSRPVRWTYPISGTQKHYFSRGARPQLYLVQFRELIDVDVLERALGDVVGRHGLMRSVLVRSLGRRMWKEHEPPMTFTLPRIDLSALPLRRQEEVRAELVKREWNVDLKTDTILYQAVLVKYNERSYDMIFQFDHSIFDGASGQAFRADLVKRYQELAEGTTRALPRTRSFRHLKEQTGKGPVGIGADEIIERFDLEAWGRYGKEILAASEGRGTGRMCDVRYSVDLRRLQSGDGEDVEPFSLVLYLYARLVARLLGVDKVALDLVFNSRVYEDVDYSGVMGMVADVLPLVVSGEQGVREDLEVLIQQKFQSMNKFNVNFSNLVTGPLTALKYGKVFQTTKEARGTGFRPSCMLNFAGSTEAEYDAIWDMTLELLTEDQDTLDYADCYCVSKVSGTRQDIVILSTWVEDPAEVVSILDEEVEYLARRAAAESGESDVNVESEGAR